MNIGDVVIFKDEKYNITWIYENGNFEIKHIENLRNDLVLISEISIHMWSLLYWAIPKLLGCSFFIFKMNLNNVFTLLQR